MFGMEDARCARDHGGHRRIRSGGKRRRVRDGRRSRWLWKAASLRFLLIRKCRRHMRQLPLPALPALLLSRRLSPRPPESLLRPRRPWRKLPRRFRVRHRAGSGTCTAESVASSGTSADRAVGPRCAPQPRLPSRLCMLRSRRPDWRLQRQDLRIETRAGAFSRACHYSGRRSCSLSRTRNGRGRTVTIQKQLKNRSPKPCRNRNSTLKP